MSMIDVHSEALSSVNEAHHTFLLYYKKDKQIVYGIVEGKEDPMFYRSVIERFLPDDWKVELIPAGNRSKVIEIAETLDWALFSRKQVVFFVDRDLSAFGVSSITERENIYVTDEYSIENAIVNPDVFGRLLVEAYNVVDWTPEEAGCVLENFKNDLKAFQAAMTPLMAQILGWRRDSVKANLDNLHLPPMFSFINGRFSINSAFLDDERRIDHLATCVGAQRYSYDKLSELTAVFCEANGPASYVRGKYLIWFLANSLNHMHQNIHGFVSAYKKSPKAKLPVGPNNVMVVAAPRVRIPTSLKKFIDRTFLVHIALVSYH